MVTENVQDTAKVQLNYKDNTENAIFHLLDKFNSTYFTESE